ncbi:D-glycero-beta-D-manno-heptose-7-phosphate kinase [bacterium]|nr:MAG: D-glycero-beta-D-manno-heptose-7-phosphate kinase [bacterium]
MIVPLDRLAQLFERLENLPIAVIGDIMLDRYIWGDAERISPEAPVPIVFVNGETARLGGAANVAWNVRTLGAKPLLFGVIGKDIFGQRFSDLLIEYEIDSEHIVVEKTRPTTAKTRIIARGQQVLRIDRENLIDISAAVEKKLMEKFMDSIDEVAGIILSDYGKGIICESLLKRIVPEARKRNKFVAVDPKERHFNLYSGVSIVTPNTKEAGDAVDIKIRDYESLINAGNKLKELTGADNILITRGAEGMSLFYSDGKIENFPTMARDVYDVTGAGDSVVGVFTAVVSAGGTLREAAIISSHAAGVVVGKLGTAAASKQEIIDSVKNEINRDRKPDNILGE